MCGSDIISLLFLGLAIYFIYRLMNGNFKLSSITDKFKKGPLYENKDIKYNRDKNTKQNEIDNILDKINKVGYKNLTNAEKQRLKNN